jgi:drug/metabolite transporter (DMT)-like permease
MKTRRAWYVGSLLAFISAGLFALGDAAVRLTASQVTVWHMMFARCLVGLLAVTAIAGTTHLPILGRNRTAMIFTGIVNVAGGMCMMIALTLLPLFDAIVLLYLYPAFAAIFSPYLAHDPIDAIDWLLIGVAFAGTTLVLWSGHTSHALQWGHLVGVGTPVFQGLAFTLIRRYSIDHHALTPFFYFCLIGTLGSLWPLSVQPEPFNISTGGIIGLLVIVVLAGVGQVIMYKALAYIPSPDAGIISMTEVVFGGLLGYVIFSEPLTGRAFIGAVLIIGSGVGLNLKNRFENRAPTEKPPVIA